MDVTIKHILLPTCLVVIHFLGYVTSQECASPQFLELGKSGSVICSFEDGFYGVYWYNSTDYQQEYPIIYLSMSAKGGIGYTTGEFDIFPNGSLLIHNVSLAHDHVFTVNFLKSQRDPQIRIDVLVVVVVIPTTPAPIILSCGEETSVQNCLLEIDGPVTLVCSIRESRPAVDLKWTRRTNDGDKKVSFKSKTLAEGICYTSNVTTDLSFSSSFVLVLFACQANSPSMMLERSESFILIQNAQLNWAGVLQIPKVFQRFSQMALVCTERNINAFVWKKVMPSQNASENILYAVDIEEVIVNTLNDDFYVENRNSLTLPRIDINHEGLYACVYSDGIAEDMTLYDVSVLVRPVPSNPVIEGCSSNQKCALEVMRDGVLTCSIKGIRPEIRLEWSAFHDSEDDVIAFSNHKSHVREKENLFDVSLTVNYTVKKVSEDKMTVKCHGVGLHAEHFRLMTKVDLLLLNGLPLEPSNAPNNGATFRHWWWIIPLVMVAMITAIVLVTAVFQRRRKGKQFASTVMQIGENASNSEETVPMIAIQSSEDPKQSGKQSATTLTGDETTDTKTVPMTITKPSEDPNQSDQAVKRRILIQQLKQRYEDLYNGVTIVPYRADEMYCVDRVYKECVIEHLLVKERGQETWRKIHSYEEVFTYDETKSTRRILHGEPGYGKSIVCLKVACVWCNSKLKTVEVLILLHLKQLGGVNSIYTAIKRYILPRDTRLTEDDIEEMLGDCKSVLLILDGFDEYPDQATNTVTDVDSIISRRMFQECTVVITTRSSFTPSKYPPQTEIYRLAGFDDVTRNTYIHEIINNDETANAVQAHLKKHPVLQDLSQVPLLLACFVHMIQEGDNIKMADSVTKVFRQIISCFHSHMRSKRMFEDIRKYDLFGTNHHDLDEITFETLSGDKMRIVWGKDELVKKVGLDFYKQYTQIGILVEEQGMDIVKTSMDKKDTVYKTEVSFVHKLFCEWYAANHLSRLSTRPGVKINELVERLDPSSLQYVYRFACGLSIDSAKKLIESLPKLQGGEKCATLCIQEQLGEIDLFKDTISLICQHGIIISKHDNILLQRSSIALLRIAQDKNINVKSLCLYNCLKSVDTSAITTSSGETVTAEIPVERLKINVTDRTLFKNEAVDILKFSVKCAKLNYIKFGNCVPPEHFEDKELLGNLQKRKITVKWRLDFDSEFYTLNFETGKWMEDPRKGQKEAQPKKVLSNEEYEALRKENERAIARETAEKCKNDVEKGREILRSSGVKK